MTNQENHIDIISKLNELRNQNAILNAEIEKFHTYFDNAPLGIFRATLGGKYVEVNNTFARMLGFNSPDEVIKNVKDIGSEIYLSSSERKRIVRNLTKGGGSLKYDTFFRRKDGTIFPVRLYFKLSRENNGNTLFLSGIVEDITEQKNTEEYLLQERNQLKTLIDAIPDYIYLKDINGRFILSNQAFEKLLNCHESSDLLGRSDEEINLPGLAAELLANDKQILSQGKPFNNSEISVHNKDKKETHYYYISKVPLKDRKGRI